MVFNELDQNIVMEANQGKKYLSNLDKIDISPDDKYLALTAKNNNDIWIISLSDM